MPSNQHYNMKTTRKFILLIILIFFISIEGIVVFHTGVLPFRKNESLQKLADGVISKCNSANLPTSCYDEEIPNFMVKNLISMEDAFEVTKLVQQKDPKYLYCHVLAHKISFQETSKDLSKWKDVVARCPTTICNNGCQHGALMRRFNSESLTEKQISEILPDLQNVCEPRGKWNPVEVERSMCYHALGHLNMYITNADINKSVDICKEIGTKSDGRNYVQTCTQGVLMTIYQPLEAEDKKLVKDLTPKKEDVVKFCRQFEGEKFDACHVEAWPLFWPDVLKPEELVKFCNYTKNEASQEKCYASVMNIIVVELAINQGSIDKLKDYCLGLPKKGRTICFSWGAARMIQIDPRYINEALKICKAAKEAGVEDNCHKELAKFARTSFHPDSDNLKQYCSKLPSPWDTKCLSQKFQ